MPTQVQSRRGTTSQHSSFTGAAGELTVDTDKKTVVVHDGSTAGGAPLLRENQSNLPTSAPTTGIYNASGSLAISTNGTGRVFIDSSGRVGIGTASPSQLLNVSSSGTATVSCATSDTSGPSIGRFRAVYVGGGGGTTSFVDLRAGSGYGYLLAESNVPLLFGTNNTERLRITETGLVGIGTSTPGAQLELRNSADSNFGQKIYHNSTALATNRFPQLEFSQTPAGQSYENKVILRQQNRDGANWPCLAVITNAAGAGENTRLFVDGLTGSVGIGATTVSDLLHVRGVAPNIRIDGGTSPGTYGVKLYGDATEQVNFTYNNQTGENRIGGVQSYIFPTFFSGGSERARIDTSGRLLVGTSTALTNVQHYGTNYTPVFQVQGTNQTNSFASITRTDGYSPHLFFNTGSSGNNPPSGRGLGTVVFNGFDGTNYVNAAAIEGVVDGTPGTNDMPGRLVFSTTADGASSPTERMRIDSGGALRHTGAGSIATSTGYSSVGVAMEPGGVLLVTRSSYAPMWVNRLTNDGTLIDFGQDTVAEGSISVSGTTVSYNGAHLSRWSQIPGIDPYDKTARPEILRGTVMSNLDEMCDWVCPTSGDCQDNEQLNKTKISDVDGDKNVAGVFQGWDDDDDTWVNDFYLAMTGDFIIRIGAGVTVERGDLLMSAGDGTAKPQDDDIIRSKTIAKITSTNVSCTYDDGSYCVPCVLMAC